MARVTKSMQDVQKQLVVRIARDGSSIEKICEESGVPKSTLFDWYDDPAFYDAFQAARCKGERVNNHRVIDSIYLSACGYEKNCVKILPDGTAVSYPVKVSPDVKAAIFILSSTDPKRWGGDKQKVELSGDVSAQIVQYRIPSNGRLVEADADSE